MNSHTDSDFPSKRPMRRRGIALILVLAALLMIGALVLSFLSSVTNDARSSSVFSEDARAKQLSESVTNLVMGQIIEATKGFKAGGNTDANRLAWASQPGAIRTYDTSGNAFQVFKLYSSSTMVGNATSSNFTADLPTIADASAITSGNHSIFTDLNSPVVDGGNQTVFPIADPAALGSVEGFTASNNSSLGTVTGNSTQPRLLMPTRWLYMLKDGTLASATGNATTATVTGASASNPIVGRVAFWTDDETSKVNINTAGEGTYWDTPRLSFKEDWDFANFQPAQKEFQRYPGHPAMTSLAPVFFATSNTTTGNLTTAQRNALYLVTPRIVGGGSNAGTAIATGALTPDSDRLYASVDELLFTANRTTQNSSTAITANSVRQRAFFLTASSRAPEVTIFNTPRVSMWPIHKLSTNGTLSPNRTTAFDKLIAFCSTINKKPYYFQREDSKSPTNDWANIARNREVLRYLRTLSGRSVPGFGASLVSKTTAADRDQLLVEMLDYIRSTNLYDDNLSPNEYASQSDADNAVQFTSGRKTGTTLDAWIGHGVVAPLRVPAGLSGTTYPSQPDTTSPMGFGRFHTISEAGMLFICNADGKNGTFNAPLKDDGTPMPSSTAPSVEQLARMASNVAPGTATANRTFGYFLDQRTSNTTFDWSAPIPTVGSGTTVYPENKLLTNTPLASNQRRIQMMLFFDYFSPMHGWTQYNMDGSLDVEFTGDFSINGTSLGMVSGEIVNFDNLGTWGYFCWGANLGYRTVFASFGDLNRGNAGGRLVPARGVMSADNGAGNVLRRYGLISAPITITVPPDGTMSFTGPSKVLVKIYSRQKDTGRTVNRSATDLVQTIDLNFPTAKFPIPVLKTEGTKNDPDWPGPTAMENWWALNAAGAFSAATVPAPPWDAGQFGRLKNIMTRPAETAGTLIQSSDTLRTLVPYHGDIRLVAGSHYVPAGVFQPSTFYYDTTRNDDVANATKYGYSDSSATPPPQIQSYLTSSGTTYEDAFGAYYRPLPADRLVKDANYSSYRFPKFPGVAVSNNATRRSARPFQQWGDFDNGVGYNVDGPYINKPDEGNNARSAGVPYFNNSWAQAAGGATFFSPNRQVPSPGMFGSLPTRMRSGNVDFDPAPSAANGNNTWRTLLLRPQSGHPGATNPPDHLWTDLFWMPVVEPYAISEPFSTAGKINMNYAIAPFDYITRKTGMAALLRAEKIPAIDNSVANTYKIQTTSSTTTSTRLNLNIAETLKQWDAKFAGNQLFVSSSQICDLHLVPQGETVSGMSTFWSTRAITGDNSRERPYTNLLGRLTTKSNSFTVHFRVQVLKKNPNTPANQWVEGRDNVSSEYRGSTLIERYIDPNNTSLPDFATTPSANIDDYYRFRVIQTRKFAP
jgi:uncharacterized protein (TIGR02600 family)